MSTHPPHVLKTYTHLRLGMSTMGFLFPILLLFAGFWLDIPQQPSLSAYYHAHDKTRDIFVGLLVAIGIFLYLYQGDTRLEDWLLNGAGIGAIGVAGFEMAKGNSCATLNLGFSLHGLFASIFFATISCACFHVAWWPKHDNLGKYLAHHKLLYSICAVVMLTSLALTLVYALWLPLVTKVLLCSYHFIFYIETIGIWGFAAFWLLRTIEEEEVLRPRHSHKTATEASHPAPNSLRVQTPVN